MVLLRDHRPLQGYTYTLGLAGIVLLLLPLLPGLGIEKFGAQIWIQVGRYSFQPAEAAKVLLAVAFAPTWSRSATCWPWPAGGSSASTCPGPATSGRSC